MNEIDKCPFCKSEAELKAYDEADITILAYVECEECEATGPAFTNNSFMAKEGDKIIICAIEAWNQAPRNS